MMHRLSLLAALVLAVVATTANAQCPGGICPVPGGYSLPYSVPAPSYFGGCTGGMYGYPSYGGYTMPRVQESYSPIYPPPLVRESYQPYREPAPPDPYRYAYRPLLRLEIGRPFPGRFVVRRWR